MADRFDRNLILALDMYGCPNRCGHCWLGHLPNTMPQENADEMLVNYFAPYFRLIIFYSWVREPDFCRDYESRWHKDNELSINAKPERFELASFWRLVRDDQYVEFLKKTGVETVQLTFFGLKQTTDAFIGRKGAFEELLKATQILIDNEIAPRWQVFLYQSNRDQVTKLLSLSKTLKLENKCQAFGRHFRFFVHEGSCDGENAALYKDRINKKDIPDVLIPYYENYDAVFSEKELCENYKDCSDFFVPHNKDDIILYAANNFDVYFNFTHLKPEWKIGNILTDRKEDLIDRIINEEILPLQLARMTPIGKLIRQYGDFSSEKAFSREDYFQYLLNQYAEDCAAGRKTS